MSLRRSALTDSLYCLKNAIPQFIGLTLCMVFLQYLLYSTFFSQHDLFNTTWSSFVHNYFTSSELRTFNNLHDDLYIIPEEEMNKAFQMLFDILNFQCFYLFTQLLIKSSIICGTLAIIYCFTKYDKTDLIHVVKKTVSYLPIVLLINFINDILVFFGLWFFILPGVFFLYVFQLVPIIKIVEQTSLLQAAIRSFNIMFKNSVELLPILLSIFLINGVIVGLVLSIITVNNTIFFTGQVVLVINTAFTIFITIYLLRFYILTTQKTTYNANQFM